MGSKQVQDWNQMKVVLRLLGVPWGLLGAPWEDPWGTRGVPGTGPAPGTQKVLKVCNSRQKQAWTQISQHDTVPDFGTH